MSPLVKPEFGPSLPEVLGVRLPRWVPWAALGALVLLMVVAFVTTREVRPQTRTIEVKSPVAFSVAYPPESFERLPARGRDLVRLATPPGSAEPAELDFRRVVLPDYEGQRWSAFPLLTRDLIQEMSREDPDFVVRGERSVNYNGQDGFQVFYQTERGGKTWYGRRIVVFPDSPADARVGVAVDVRVPRSANDTPRTVWQVAQSNPLLNVLRSVEVSGR